MKSERFTKNAGIIDTILKIIQGFFLVVAIISVIFVPLSIVFGEKMIVSENQLVIGTVKLLLDGDVHDYLDTAYVSRSIAATLAASFVTAVVYWFGLKILREILKPMKEGRPFEAGISVKMKNLAWLTLIGGALIEIVQAVEAYMDILVYNLNTVFEGSAVTYVTFNYEVDGAFIVEAVILFFLAYIFRYGEDLQVESDETL